MSDQRHLLKRSCLFSLYLLLSLSLFCAVSCTKGFSDTRSEMEGVSEGLGYIDVQVTASEGFDNSLMINLTDQAGANYLIIAESFNGWKANDQLLAGVYQIDFVGIDSDLRQEYSAAYPDEIEINQGKGTLLPIEIKQKKSNQEALKKVIGSGSTPEVAAQQPVGFERLAAIVKKGTPTMILILIGLVVLMVLKKIKEKKGGEG